jgi:hypothetical protein
MMSQVLEGVWLSEQPLSVNEGAKGDTVLKVTFNCSAAALDYWEVVEEGEGPGYREWLMPAEFINKNATVRRATAIAGARLQK